MAANCPKSNFCPYLEFHKQDPQGANSAFLSWVAATGPAGAWSDTLAPRASLGFTSERLWFQMPEL